MRRDQNIIALSREHHYGLLFCWKIRQGLAKRVDLERIRKYVLHFWKFNLQDHFAEEELFLFRDRFDSLCIEAKQQHGLIRNLIQAVQGGGGRTEIIYRELADQVDKHIRFEERKVFPFLEQDMTKEQLSAVGEHLGRLHTTPADDNYQDEFWG